MRPVSGLILLDKPRGTTSFKALGMIKRKLGTTKIGHTGTLDPFASGLLPVLSEKATRFTPFFSSFDKTYEARIEFGVETDTLDPEGAPVHSAPVPGLAEIESVLPRFLGETVQIPPAFSAIHIGGKRAYALAREGKQPEIPPRRVRITSLDIMAWESPFLDLRVSCSSGTYIRALARDLGAAAGSRASLAGLRRTVVGPFTLGESVLPDNFDPERDVIPVSRLVPLIPGIARFTVPAEVETAIPFGKPLDPAIFPPETGEGAKIALFGTDGGFLGMAEKREGRFPYLFVYGDGR